MNWLTSRSAPLGLAALLALAGCDKGTDLNVDLPDTTGIKTDYFDIDLGAQAATVQIKSVESLKADHYLVGRLQDNVAGTTTARAYLNTVMTVTADSLPGKFADPRLDSVVVVLTYDKVYGSTATPVRFNISNLPAKLDDRQVYNSGTLPSAPITEVLGLNVPGKINRTQQTTSTGTDTTPPVTTTSADPMVRLVLQRSVSSGAGTPVIASPFFNNLFAAMSATAFSQTQLDGLLKGLAIEPSAAHTGSILSFGRGAVSRIEVFFHDQASTTPTKWHAYPLLFGPVYSYVGAGQSSTLDPRYYTQLDTDLGGSALAQLAQPGSQSVPATSLSNTSYLQEGTGLGTRISLSGLVQLENLRNLKGLAINRAELRIPIKPYSNVLFPNPSFVYALEANAANDVLERVVNYVPTDRVVQADGANPQGINSEAIGTIVNGTTTQPYYSLIITSYLQAYLNNNLDGDLPAALVLVPNIRRSTSLSMNRAAIDADNIHLFVYYSQQ
jgi:hypothetical protein